MLAATEFINFVFTHCQESDLIHSALREFLLYQPNDDFSGERLERIRAAAARESDADGVRLMSAGFGTPGDCLAAVLDESWRQELPDEILNLPIDSTVGAMCLQLIVQSDWRMLGMDSQPREWTKAAAAAQCAVWFFG